MKEMFSDVLEREEEIIAVYKPNKCKTAWWWILVSLSSLIWIPLVGLIGLGEDWFWLALGVSLGITALCALIAIVAGLLWWKNRFFAYTNKRILIRGGIIGIDYKSLEFKSLTATAVVVSLLDKLVRKRTGSIRFGSAASPMVSVFNSHSNQFIFQHIQKPYDVLREIKEHINSKESSGAQ